MTSIEHMQVSKAISCFRPNKLTLAATVRAKHIDRIKNISITAWRIFFKQILVAIRWVFRL